MNIVDTISNITQSRSEKFLDYTKNTYSDNEFGLQMQLLVMDRYDNKVSLEYAGLQVKIAEKLLKKFSKIDMPVDIITNANSFDLAMNKSMSMFDKVKNLIYSPSESSRMIDYIMYTYANISAQK